MLQRVPIGVGCALVSVLAGLTAPASAALDESEVLLLYYCLDFQADPYDPGVDLAPGVFAESFEVAQYYLMRHPGVTALNLADPEHPDHPHLDFSLVFSDPPPADPNAPGDYAADQFYITPLAYRDWIHVPLRQYLQENPQFRSVVTTRGVPVMVSDRWNSQANSIQYFQGGVEAVIARIMFEETDGEPFGTVDNPYYTFTNTTIQQFEAAQHPCLPRVYLVSRLDSQDPLTTWVAPCAPEAPPSCDYDCDGDCDNVDSIKALIDRSIGLSADKFAVGLAVDDLDDCSILGFGRDQDAVDHLHDLGYRVFYDNTVEFLHGVHDPDWSAALEGPYTVWTNPPGKPIPVLMHLSAGSNSDECSPAAELPFYQYVRDFEPHPAGMFMSQESFNGLTLRKIPTGGHGQVIDWIAIGGTFTCGNVAEPGSGQAHPDYATVNLYEHGLSWGESVYSSLPLLGKYQTPVGDPLATVRVYDSNLSRLIAPTPNNGDRIDRATAQYAPSTSAHRIDFADIQVLLAAWGNCAANLPEDLDGDGCVGAGDLQIILSLWMHEREALGPPNASAVIGWPFPGVPGTLYVGYADTGDANRDGEVNRTDLDLVVAHFGETCSEFEASGDGSGTIDLEDVRQVLCNWGNRLGDVNGDCLVDGADLNAVTTTEGPCPAFPAPCPEASRPPAVRTTAISGGSAMAS